MRHILKDILVLLCIYMILLLSVDLFLGYMVFSKTEKLLLIGISILLNLKLMSINKKIIMFYIINISLLISILGLNCLLFDDIQLDTILKYYLFSFGIINIILGIFSLKISKIIKLLIWSGVVLLPVLFIWSYYVISQSWLLTADTLIALLQTNFKESYEYLYSNLNFYNVLVFIFFVYLALYFIRKDFGIEFSKPINKVLVGIMVFFNILMLYKGSDNLFVNAVNDVKIYVDRFEKFKELSIDRKEKLSQEIQINKNNDKIEDGIFVLVIGESQNRNHMNIYGYSRNNTPYLSEMKNLSNFLLFTNAYSCHTHTVPALTYALTAKNQYNDMELQKAVSLIEVAEAAGFETVWISNQVKYSMWDTPITIIADEANQQFWINSTVGEKTDTVYYDDKLVEQLKKVKYSEKMLIVFHLMGNHGSYKERYPKKFNKYSENTLVDQYDNSILFNDYVIENILENIKNVEGFKGMLYFADHADAVDQGLAHDSNKFVRDMTEIPLFMYFSDQYINNNESIFYNLKKSQDKYITNDLIFNTMLGIMGISTEKLYEDNNDITKNKYDFRKERFKTMYGEEVI